MSTSSQEEWKKIKRLNAQIDKNRKAREEKQRKEREKLKRELKAREEKRTKEQNARKREEARRDRERAEEREKERKAQEKREREETKQLELQEKEKNKQLSEKSNQETVKTYDKEIKRFITQTQTSNVFSEEKYQENLNQIKELKEWFAENDTDDSDVNLCQELIYAFEDMKEELINVTKDADRKWILLKNTNWAEFDGNKGSWIVEDVDSKSVGIEYAVDIESLLSDTYPTLTQTNQVSTKVYTKTEMNELLLKHVCMITCTIVHDAFSLLKDIDNVYVDIADKQIDPATGHDVNVTVLSTHISREDMEKINYNRIEPSAFVLSLEPNIKFLKTKGLQKVDSLWKKQK